MQLMYRDVVLVPCQTWGFVVYEEASVLHAGRPKRSDFPTSEDTLVFGRGNICPPVEPASFSRYSRPCLHSRYSRRLTALLGEGIYAKHCSSLITSHDHKGFLDSR